MGDLLYFVVFVNEKLPYLKIVNSFHIIMYFQCGSLLVVEANGKLKINQSVYCTVILWLYFLSTSD